MSETLTLTQSILLATGTLLVTLGGAAALLRGQVTDLRDQKKGLDDRLKAVEEKVIKTNSDVEHLGRAHWDLKAEIGKSETRILEGIEKQFVGFRREVEALLERTK